MYLQTSDLTNIAINWIGRPISSKSNDSRNKISVYNTKAFSNGDLWILPMTFEILKIKEHLKEKHSIKIESRRRGNPDQQDETSRIDIQLRKNPPILKAPSKLSKDNRPSEKEKENLNLLHIQFGLKGTSQEGVLYCQGFTESQKHTLPKLTNTTT